MKVLSLSNCPLVATQGSGYVTMGFCERLRARGHEVDLFGPESFEPMPQLRGRARSYRQALGMLAFCRRQTGRKRYDVIEFWGGESWLAARTLSRRARRPLLVSHSNGLETHLRDVLQRHERAMTAVSHAQAQSRAWYHLDQSRWMRHAFTGVDGLVTVSGYDADYARRHAYQPCGRVAAIENSLSDEFLNLDVMLRRGPVIGFCGSWIERKGTAAMQQALTAILTKNSDARGLLIGVGESFDKRTIYPEVSSRVDVVPFVEDKGELRSLYARMSVLMLPSIYESFGLAAAEAMACGCALVATRTGFAASLRHGEEAWLLENGSAAALQSGLESLLSNESLRLRVARGGYERVQQLRWSDAVSTLEQTYERWLREKS